MYTLIYIHMTISPYSALKLLHTRTYIYIYIYIYMYMFMLDVFVSV
jgi:hypothetical protein